MFTTTCLFEKFWFGLGNSSSRTKTIFVVKSCRRAGNWPYELV